MSELEDKDIEGLVERLDMVEKELAECIELEEEGREEATMKDVPIGRPPTEWNKRGYVQIKRDGEGMICYLRANRGGDKASVSKKFDFSGINRLSFDYRHTYQTKKGQLKVYLDGEAVYDTTMVWGACKGAIDTSEVSGTAELRFEVVSNNPWYATGNVNLYLYTMNGGTRKFGDISPMFDRFKAKETAIIRNAKLGASVASDMTIRNVGKAKGKIYVVFSDLDTNKKLATGSCTLNPMETIFPFIYCTKTEVVLSKGGYGGYAYVKDAGERHFGIKIWGEGENEPEFEGEDTLQMKTWGANIQI